MAEVDLFTVEKRFFLGEDRPGEDFPEFDAPLIEAVDPPDDSLDEDLVFIKSNQLT